MREYRIYMDGNAWCATATGFINLQESNAGFGDSPLEALADLIGQEESAELEDILHDFCKPDAIFGMGA
jgi:hypothetical protein